MVRRGGSGLSNGRSISNSRRRSALARPTGLGNKPAVERQIGEAAAAAQKQRLCQGLLEMAVGSHNDTILVRNTEVVARGDHVVMRTKRCVGFGLIFRGIMVEIMERCG